MLIAVEEKIIKTKNIHPAGVTRHKSVRRSKKTLQRLFMVAE